MATLCAHPTRTWHSARGMHICLGASLARLEAQIAIRRLMQRMPKLALADGPLEWRANGRFRGLNALPVTL